MAALTSETIEERRKKCSHWFPEENRFCGEPGLLYPNGIRCDEHAPWKVRGLKDPREQVKVKPTPQGETPQQTNTTHQA